MIDTTVATATIVIPLRYRTSASALIEAAQRAGGAIDPAVRGQHVAVARMWYDTLAENLRALKHEAADTRGWIRDHEDHPLTAQMQAHLASLLGDARLLDRALTDLFGAMVPVGTGDAR